jgi:hypothetical protein
LEKSMKLQLAAVFAVTMLSAAAHAANACKDDVAKFCATEKPGEGRVAMCLKAHEAELSAGCKAHEAEMKAKMEEWTEACKADRDTLCKDVQAGGGRVAACMHDNEAKLSKPCKAKFGHVKKHMEQIHKDCAADMKAHCAASKTHAEKMTCLGQNMDALQPACKEHLDNIQ